MIVDLETVKLFLQITETTKDELIEALIPQVEGEYEKIRGISFDVDSNDEIEYPEGSELIASQMVGYLIQSGSIANMSDKKSESIGSYSYTKGGTESDTINGYPKLIVGRIKRYYNPKT